MNDVNKEKRLHPRMAVRLLVEYKSLSDFFVDYALDISHGGMFVATDKKIEIGSPVSVRFTLPDESEQFEAAGAVVRKGDRPEKGVGIQFEPLSDRARGAIERLWENKLKE